MQDNTMLGIRSKIKLKLLKHFFLNERKENYINELARIISADPKNVYRALISLKDQDILASRFKGKERYFYCNTSGPLYGSYKEIFLGTQAVKNGVKNKSAFGGGEITK